MFKTYISVKPKYIICSISQLYEKAQTYPLNAWKDICLYQNSSVTEQQAYFGLDLFGSPGSSSFPIKSLDSPLVPLLQSPVLHDRPGALKCLGYRCTTTSVFL